MFGLRSKGGVAPQRARELVEEGALVLDVREPHEWQAGRIPGALHIPMGELGRRVDEVPRDRTVVVACRSGGRSATVTRALSEAGYRAENLHGGLKAWARAELPLEPDGARVA
jgi:rhodanese-related sulfurtransferase